MASLSSFAFPLLLLLLLQAPLPGESLRVLPEQNGVGTRWAVLIAGSKGYENYRHQADVCHAYQILKNGGLNEENIIVFMYDDIANNTENPRPGVIINHPSGGDVYAGVPKDYTGEDVNVQNFLAALLGDKASLTGSGSRKVLSSGPEDHVFVYYVDHGGPGILGMPSGILYASDLVRTLEMKYAGGAGFKTLVFYLEACEAGSIFDGLLPANIGIYATTASNSSEPSWGAYCPGNVEGAPPPEYDTCLGDLYSVSWMEDMEAHDLNTEPLRDQYIAVKERTSAHHTYINGSHVSEYGELRLKEKSLFMGDNSSFVRDASSFSTGAGAAVNNQRDADLLYFWRKYRRAAEGSAREGEARRELMALMARRAHIDRSVELISRLVFVSEDAHKILNAVRSAGLPLVDDWTCLKSMVRRFEDRCGPLTPYGFRHVRALARMCNSGVLPEAMEKAASNVCRRGRSHP